MDNLNAIHLVVFPIEPVFSDPAPSFPEPQAPVPPTADLFQVLAFEFKFLSNPPLLQSLLETGGGGLTTGGGVFGAVERASNGSPAGSWGRSASPRRAPSSSNNMWGAGEGWDHPPASQAVQPNPGLGGGWDHAPTLAQGAQLVPQHATHSTNPFGTSPSNPTYHAPGDYCYVMLNTLLSKKLEHLVLILSTNNFLEYSILNPVNPNLGINNTNIYFLLILMPPCL